MTDWFRQTEWSATISADFDARLQRARSKAQVLNVQCWTLLASRPDVAADLARRAIACDDESQTARACLYLGTALALAGDPDAAIEALEQAIDAERRAPQFRTGAALDQALLVAMARRSDLYDLVWERLADERARPLSERSPTALAAQALIGHDRGFDMRDVAREALSQAQDLAPTEPLGQSIAERLAIAALP